MAGMDRRYEASRLAGVDQAAGEGAARAPSELLDQLRERLARLDASHPSSLRRPADDRPADDRPAAEVAADDTAAVDTAADGEAADHEAMTDRGGAEDRHREAVDDRVDDRTVMEAPATHGTDGARPGAWSDDAWPGGSGRGSAGPGGADWGSLDRGGIGAADPYRPWFATGEPETPWFLE